MVALDGSRSYDPDGTIISYQWKQIAGPIVTINASQQVITTTGRLNLFGVYSFELTVFDNKGAMAKDTATVEYKKRSSRFF